ncbi:MAG: ATP-dependent helicase [Coriobacteriales bacterium]|jgi:DNA helicase-2/ATP-dependent DNA helicase PcrA|nr:ATP-dependent helicase [Coriobacteriales bacterium]
MSAITDELQAEYDRLNADQKKAVDTLDGPVLVVAGPGTGKTQLLALRAVNILREKDVSPANILCLTYTDAGVRAMTGRLIKFIGRDAYGISVSTFHGLAENIRAQYPEYFARGPFSQPITNLQAAQLVDRLLRELPISDPLFQNPYNGVHGGLNAMKDFITSFKRSGLEPSQLRAITQQSLGYLEFLTQETEFFALVNRGTSKEKREVLAELESLITRAPSLAPRELTRPLVMTPGVYTPYATYLERLFSQTELIEPQGGKTTGFQDLRKRLLEKDDDGEWCAFKDVAVCAKTLSALGVYARYQEYLSDNGLYDYDDMILDALAAIEGSPRLKGILQEQYRYIQVDEFQDTNGVQMRLVDLLTDASPLPNVLVVGDDDQAIMRFQGASVEYIRQFEEHYSRVCRCVLKTNYRSTPSLVELGQTVARQIEGRSEASRQEKDLRAHRTENEARQFSIRSYPSEELQYYAVAEVIRQRIDEGFLVQSAHEGSEIAVIAARHNSLRGLIPYLKLFEVPFNYTYTTTVSQIASMQTLLALLRFIAEYAQGRLGYAEAQLPQILAARELGLEPDDYIAFAFEAKGKHLNKQWLEALKTSANPKFKRLHGWLTELIGLAATKPVRHFLHLAARPLAEHYRAHEDSDPITLIEFNYGLSTLLQFVEGELGGADQGLSAVPMRLADVVGRFAEADRLGIRVDVSIPVKRERAVTLTTAHSSKGLEFDLVYLLDADDKTWHRPSKEGGYLAGNLLFRKIQDDDDVRRLLFVAATRARFEFEATRGGGETVRELLGTLEEAAVEASIEDISIQAQESWQEHYRLDTAELQALAQSDIRDMKMSASRLNAFVDYRSGAVNSTEFISSGILGLPREPSGPAEFGNAVHGFMEAYVNRVLIARDSSLEAQADACRRVIAALDFEETDIAHMQQRFNGIVEKFVPCLGGYLTGRPVVEGWVKAELDGIPLVGKCDLLVLDEETKTVRVYDYKTKSTPPDKPSLGYIRQLQFYRLLIESSPAYEGWRLDYSADLYVEPMRERGYELLEPVLFKTTDAQLEHLKLLIKAVWWRIQNGLFDTTAFEDSELYAAVKPSSYKKDGSLKAQDEEPVQTAYEQWLIDEWRQNAGDKNAAI